MILGGGVSKRSSPDYFVSLFVPPFCVSAGSEGNIWNCSLTWDRMGQIIQWEWDGHLAWRVALGLHTAVASRKITHQVHREPWDEL